MKKQECYISYIIYNKNDFILAQIYTWWESTLKIYVLYVLKYSKNSDVSHLYLP